MTVFGSTPSAHYLRSRMSRVCVAITGTTPQEMIEKTDAVVRESPFVEFRLDYLDKPLAAIPLFRDFLYERSEITAVATCRRVAGGGKFKGAASAELEILTQAAKAGFSLIDLEIETADAISKAQFEALRSSGAGVILSSHDFENTKDLDKTFARLKAYAPDFYKIVSTARNLSDNVEMKRFLERTSDSANVIGICMGEQGLISRVLGVRAGSVFTFAAANAGEETGAGQVSARTLIETYRIDQIDTATKVYGVAGNPIRHSLSPVMMNSAFRRETVNGVFLPLETKKLSDLLKLVQEVPIQGLAITMPLKQEILPYLAKTDPISEKIGACNTIVRSMDGRLFGFNTDVGGIVRPLERRLQLRGAKVLVLGAGGAARAAVFGLVEKGAEVTILNRTPETAQKLARQAKAKTIKREQVAKSYFDVILNATPAGMTGQKLQMILNPEELNTRLVFDTVYNPIDTPLIRAAREKGISVITGVEMFVQQGARQFEIWTGKPAPEEEMLRVVLHALRRRGEAPQTPVTGPRIVPPLLHPVAAPSAPVSVAVPASPVARAAATPVKAPVPVPVVAKTAPRPENHPQAKTVSRVDAARPAALKTISRPETKTARPIPAKPSAPPKPVVKAMPKPVTKVAVKHAAPIVLSKPKTAQRPVPGKHAPARSVVTKSPARPAAKSLNGKAPGKAAAPPIKNRIVARAPAKLNGNGDRKVPAKTPARPAANHKTAKHVGSGKVPRALLTVAAKAKKSAAKR